MYVSRLCPAILFVFRLVLQNLLLPAIAEFVMVFRLGYGGWAYSSIYVLLVMKVARTGDSGSLVFVPVFLKQSPTGSLIVSSPWQIPTQWHFPRSSPSSVWLCSPASVPWVMRLARCQRWRRPLHYKNLRRFFFLESLQVLQASKPQGNHLPKPAIHISTNIASSNYQTRSSIKSLKWLHQQSVATIGWHQCPVVPANGPAQCSSASSS